MLLNYLITAIRNFKRHSFYSLLNVIGLTIGIACFILIFLWIDNQVNIDTFHKNPERIYQVYTKTNYSDRDIVYNYVTPPPLSPVLKEEIPEIEFSTRYIDWVSLNVRKDGRIRQEMSGKAVDTDFFEIFNFPIIKGKITSAFNSENQIVITENFAKKHFKEVNPIGEILTLDNEKLNLKVVAVIKSDKKRITAFHFEYIVPFHFFEKLNNNEYYNTWGNHCLLTYIKLKSKSNTQAVNEKIKNLLKTKNNDDIYLSTINLNDKYLYHLNGAENQKKYLKMLAFVAFLILSVACINFMNLSTARSANRSKEVGMRKVVGASRKQLIFQFLIESILLSVISTIIAVGFVELILPSFRNFASANIYIKYNFSFFAFLFLTSVITGLFAGSYPAFFLSSFRPAIILKGKLTQGTKGGFFRKILVVFQFSLSIAFIVITIFIYRQMQYVTHKDMGIKRENIVCVSMQGDFVKKYENFRKDLLDKQLVISMTASLQAPVSIGSSTFDVNWAEKDPNAKINFGIFYNQYDFIETFGMRLVAGRDFSRAIKSDEENAVLINEKASEIIGKDDIIGKEITIGDGKRKIIGVIKNFNFNHFSKPIDPLVILFDTEISQEAFFKLKGENISETLKEIEKIWNKHFPDYIFNYTFLDKQFNDLYFHTKKRISHFTYFSIIAIIISCLGLFGLAAFITQQRTKEIGIRKIMGATNRIIIRIISFDFIVLVLIANVIALPLAYLFVNDFLSGYSYKIDILENSWIFILSAFMALFIAQITVGYQALKTLNANPVDALRYE